MERACMGSFREYRKAAAECARLAQVAPSQEARASFSVAAKRWMMLAHLAAEGSMRAESSVMAVRWKAKGKRLSVSVTIGPHARPRCRGHPSYGPQADGQGQGQSGESAEGARPQPRQDRRAAQDQPHLGALHL